MALKHTFREDKAPPFEADLFAPVQIARYVLCSMTSFLQHKKPLLPERAEKLQSRFSWKRERDALNAGDVVKH